jgi:LacI family transcriptional regulator
MGKVITLDDVARKSKVSTSTVSLVLRDKPGIPADTRKRVLAVAKSLGYQKKIHSSGKKQNHTPSGRRILNIGIVIKSESGFTPEMNPFYSQVLIGIEEACRQRNMNLLFATISVNADNIPLEIPHILSEHRTDGFLLVGAFLDETLAHVLGEKPLSFVLVDAYTKFDRYDAVLSDNFHGAYSAVEYLIRCGHQKIGIIGSNPNAYPSFLERRSGYLAALRDNKITKSFLGDCHYDNDQISHATEALLRKNPEITALFGVNDHATILALRIAQTMGRKVPEDISLIGFDDIDFAKHVIPSLTTMHVDKLGMGRMAVQMLTNRIEFPDSEQMVTVLKPSLVVRESTKLLGA